MPESSSHQKHQQNDFVDAIIVSMEQVQLGDVVRPTYGQLEDRLAAANDRIAELELERRLGQQ